LIAELRKRALYGPADSLSGLLAAPWTSSTEMIGALGLAVLRLQADERTFPRELAPLASRCMKEVRKVWPDIRLP